MEIVHLATSDDDLYTGFDDLKISQTTQRFSAEGASRKGRLDTMFSRAGGTRLLTSSTPAMPQDQLARPMTAIRAVGYTSYGNRGFDPLNLSSNVHGRQSVLENSEETPEEKIRQLERKINELIEESCICASKKDAKLALEKAKEASQKERIYVRQREQSGLSDQPNLDLTFIVLFNLASQYTLNELYSEALNTYHVLMRNRLFQNAGRLKVNMGNVYVKLGQYSKAIKFYRMALDQVTNTHKRMRIKIMQNIGILFVKMGKYNDAIASFEYIMGENPDFKTGLNLVLCYYALNDKEKMKRSFQKLVDIPLEIGREEDDKHLSNSDGSLREAIANDSLTNIETQKKHEAEWSILMASKLISPVIDENLNLGFSWCVDVVKGSAFLELAHELEINKAVLFLKQKEFSAAIETLKSFERKKDAKVASIAATNLSFLYLLEKDLVQANQYADVALTSDHYNPGALVNKGCCIYLQNDFRKAQEYFKEALVNEATCVEALYNLGLSLKKVGEHEDALECFTKLQAMLPNQPRVIYQLATICELLNERELSMEWYMQLLNLVPTDPGLLHKLGIAFERQGDKQQAFQYHYDSYRNYPSNTQVSTWLGAYFIDAEVYEKAVTYFERAAAMQPSEVKWQLMVASCHRRSGNYQKALAVYKGIHRKFPDNVECLKFIVRLCTDMGLGEADRYAALLTKAEEARSTGEQLGSSARSRSGLRQKREESGKEIEEDLIKRGTLSQSNEVPYIDTLKPKSERPRTSVRNRNAANEDGFSDDDQLGDLLP